MQQAWREVVEVCTNQVFVLCVLGLAANNFALGGLADWISVFLERYDGASLAEAGLVVGAGTVIGGIGGTYLGSVFTTYCDGKIKNAYFFVSACFTIPSAFVLLLCLNLHTSKGVAYTMLFVFNLFVWTNVAPINALCINCIPVPLRARAAGLAIFFQHILGDIISPPLIGYLSDKTGSLRFALQITWIAVVLSGISWFAGYFFVPPLPVMEHQKEEQEIEIALSHLRNPDGRVNEKPVTYGSVLFPCCSEPVKDACDGVERPEDLYAESGEANETMTIGAHDSSFQHSVRTNSVNRRSAGKSIDVYVPPEYNLLLASSHGTESSLNDI